MVCFAVQGLYLRTDRAPFPASRGNCDSAYLGLGNVLSWLECFVCSFSHLYTPPLFCFTRTTTLWGSYLEQVKRGRGDPQMQLEAMSGFLERSGLKVSGCRGSLFLTEHGWKCCIGGNGIVLLLCCFLCRLSQSSPHLVQVRERIRINGQPISKELFSKYFWQVYNRLDESKDSSNNAMPAYFRFLTIMAFHVFLQEKVDLAVLEVGIGGTYDCTNIIRKPVVCGVSSLGIDHTSILGDTIEKIAWQKGGIFKPGVPAFTVPQPDRPLAVLKEQAQKKSVRRSTKHGRGGGRVSPGFSRHRTQPHCSGTISGRRVGGAIRPAQPAWRAALSPAVGVRFQAGKDLWRGSHALPSFYYLMFYLVN
uniref:Folylpolyglutamate synthase n=1 Tax=Varanus komodoensis TaxID=61221 RepID=A0A8D2LU98_VARKO